MPKKSLTLFKDANQVKVSCGGSDDGDDDGAQVRTGVSVLA